LSQAGSRKSKSKLKVQRFAVAAVGCSAALIAAFTTALSGAPQSRTAPAAPIAPLAPTASQLAPVAPTTKIDRTIVDQYCVTCHNQRTKTAGLALDSLNLADVAAHADVWEEVVRKLRGGLMPPAGMRRPDGATTAAFVSWLENRIDSGHTTPAAGRVPLRRLNRAE